MNDFMVSRGVLWLARMDDGRRYGFRHGAEKSYGGGILKGFWIGERLRPGLDVRIGKRIPKGETNSS